MAPAEPTPEYQTGTFTTPEGLQLLYQSIGSGPPVVLANGLGGTFYTWRHLYTHLAKRYRVISWDYRGLHGSPAPADPNAVDVAHQVQDLHALLEVLAIERAAFLGWSLGVQVVFEYYRTHAERFAAIGAINGVAGRPFDTLKGGPLARMVLPPAMLALAKHPRLVNPIARTVTGWSPLLRLLKATRVIAPTLDEDIFTELTRDFGHLDFRLYLNTLARSREHDAWDLLPTIKVPTTIIAGEKDFMTPVAAARRMSQMVPGADLVVVAGATHYAPVEKPMIINSAIDALLERAAYGRDDTDSDSKSA